MGLPRLLLGLLALAAAQPEYNFQDYEDTESGRNLAALGDRWRADDARERAAREERNKGGPDGDGIDAWQARHVDAHMRETASFGARVFVPDVSRSTSDGC